MRRRFVDRVQKGEPVVLPGADEAEWSQYGDAWIDVRDLAWILAELLERPAGGPLNALAGHFTWHDFYAEIIRLTGSASQLIQKPRSDFSDEAWQEKQFQAQTWRFDDSRLRRLLGFAPRYSLQASLEESILDTP